MQILGEGCRVDDRWELRGRCFASSPCDGRQGWRRGGDQENIAIGEVGFYSALEANGNLMRW